VHDIWCRNRVQFGEPLYLCVLQVGQLILGVCIIISNEVQSRNSVCVEESCKVQAIGVRKQARLGLKNDGLWYGVISNIDIHKPLTHSTSSSYTLRTTEWCWAYTTFCTKVFPHSPSLQFFSLLPKKEFIRCMLIIDSNTNV
jgi:hypothetical protein